jgi:thiamine pyrophosphate-dependent acetolactate synthase large subunit-like protein
MAKVTGNELLVKALKNEGVDTIFYLASAPTAESAKLFFEGGIRLIGFRHEQGAAFAAHAYSRVSGRPGVCCAEAGPGVTNLVTGVGNAFVDAVPLVALGALNTLFGKGMGSFQELDQVSILKPITKWTDQVNNPKRIPELINKAFRIATGGQPGPVYVDLPMEILAAEVDENEILFPKNPHTPARSLGDPDRVKQALALLADARRPLILTGTGVLWSGASAELREFVELTGIPFYTTPQGRGVIPEDHPLCFLSARNMAFREADVVLVVGTRFNFIVSYGMPPRWAPDLKVIQVDVAEEEIGRNRPVNVGIVGDAKMVLRQLIEEAHPVFRGRGELSWAGKLRQQDKSLQEKSAALLNSDQIPIHPLRLCKELRDFMDREAILAVDGHDTLNFARQSIPTFIPGHRVNAGPNGCMGVAIPYGLGAKAAKPGAQVIALSGDGSFGMNGFEIDTAVRNHLPVLIVVNNNGGWCAEGLMFGRELGFGRYEKVAEALGAHGEYVERPQDIRPALERAAKAVAGGKPAVVNVVTDPKASSTTTVSLSGIFALQLGSPST